MCIRDSSDGVVSEESIGNSGVASSAVEVRCGAAQAIVQMDVWRLNVTPGLPGKDLAYDLVMSCAELSLSGEVVATGVLSPAVSTSQKGVESAGVAICPAGKIAIGFDGEYGSEVNQLGLICVGVSAAK